MAFIMPVMPRAVDILVIMAVQTAAFSFEAANARDGRASNVELGRDVVQQCLQILDLKQNKLQRLIQPPDRICTPEVV